MRRRQRRSTGAPTSPVEWLAVEETAVIDDRAVAHTSESEATRERPVSVAATDAVRRCESIRALANDPNQRNSLQLPLERAGETKQSNCSQAKTGDTACLQRVSGKGCWVRLSQLQPQRLARL